MSGSSSHISWKSPDPEGTLSAGLGKLGVSLQELPSQKWDPKTLTIGGIRDYKLCTFVPDPSGWSFLLLHLYSQLGDPLATELSKSTFVPVIIFYEFDQCAWGFSIFEKGIRVGMFWNRPDVVEEDPQSCVVLPENLARSFNVSSDTLAPYLRHLRPDEDDPGPAMEDDKHSLGDHWVRCDFMKRLGLRYPDGSEPNKRHVLIREAGVNY
jgi:hypothetical protein